MATLVGIRIEVLRNFPGFSVERTVLMYFGRFGEAGTGGTRVGKQPWTWVSGNIRYRDIPSIQIASYEERRAGVRNSFEGLICVDIVL